jgi:hypothetical protein
MSRKWYLASVFAAAAALVALRPAFSGDQDAQPPMSQNPFMGKIVMVSLKSGDKNHGATFEKAQIKMLGGKPFLFGVATEDAQLSGWAKGRPMWFPLDGVAQILEFASLDDAKKLWKDVRD